MHRKLVREMVQINWQELLRNYDISLLRVMDVNAVPKAHSYLTVDAKEFLPNAKSVIVSAYCYDCKKPQQQYSEPCGTVAPYTWANFYKVLRRSLTKMCKNFSGNFKFSVNGRLAEKSWALAAGLGSRGEHSIIVTPEYGSLIVLGIAVTDIALAETECVSNIFAKRDYNENSACTGCRACVRACPTGALLGEGRLDRDKCIQHMCTQYMPLSEQMKSAWGSRIYGCSTCQDVCPLNKRVVKRETIPPVGYVGPELPLLKILKMSYEEYRALVAGNQMARRWVDFRAIKRNALLVLKDVKTEEAEKTIANFCQNDDLLLRETALWVKSATQSQ